MEITVCPQMDLYTLRRLVAASKNAILSCLWLWDLRENSPPRLPCYKRQLYLNTVLCTKLANDSCEDSSGTLRPKPRWFILHEKCGCSQESFRPFLSLPAETECSCASILSTAFALQRFAFPKLSSQDKGDSLLCFLLIKSWVRLLQSP